MDIFSSILDIGKGIVNSIFPDPEDAAKAENLLKQTAIESGKEINRHIEAIEKQITERHKNDMQSDSWLSKNIRPLIILFLTIAITGLAYLTIFILPSDKIGLIQPWIDLYTSLMLLCYAFYFGSRGIEKVQKIRREKNETNK